MSEPDEQLNYEGCRNLISECLYLAMCDVAAGPLVEKLNISTTSREKMWCNAASAQDWLNEPQAAKWAEILGINIWPLPEEVYEPLLEMKTKRMARWLDPADQLEVQ